MRRQSFSGTQSSHQTGTLAGRQSSHQSAVLPNLNVVFVGELFRRVERGGIIWLTVLKFLRPNKTMSVNVEDIGTIVSHCTPLRCVC